MEYWILKTLEFAFTLRIELYMTNQMQTPSHVWNLLKYSYVHMNINKLNSTINEQSLKQRYKKILQPTRYLLFNLDGLSKVNFWKESPCTSYNLIHDHNPIIFKQTLSDNLSELELVMSREYTNNCQKYRKL